MVFTTINFIYNEYSNKGKYTRVFGFVSVLKS